jgi:fructokinase
VVTLDGHGDAQYSFYVDGCADGGWSVDELPAVLPVGPVLHVSGALALARTDMADAVEALLRRADRVVTLDPNPRPVLAHDPGALRARLQRWLPLAQLVKVSDDDLAWLSPGHSIADIAERWRALGPAVVVVTRGRDGVYAQSAGGEVALPAPPVDLVDTVGAGDAFMGGLLAALLRAGLLSPDALSTMDISALQPALGYAQRVAAVTCSRVGADPPWLDELVAP